MIARTIGTAGLAGSARRVLGVFVNPSAPRLFNRNKSIILKTPRPTAVGTRISTHRASIVPLGEGRDTRKALSSRRQPEESNKQFNQLKSQRVLDRARELRAETAHNSL